MPKEFLNCIKKGGKVRTKKIKGGKVVKICFLKGKSYSSGAHKSVDSKGESQTAKAMRS